MCTPTLSQPTLEKRTYQTAGALFFIRTVCGLLVSRPTAGEALALYLEQEALWLGNQG
jgi:hypothetical protein